MTASRDRLIALLDPASGLNGVDYAELVEGSDPPKLRVHFHTGVALSGGAVTARLDGGDRIRTIPLDTIGAADWSADAEGRPLLLLRPLIEGDFSNYLLTLESARLDPRFTATPVSFKVFCPSKFDCEPLDEQCPPDPHAAPAIDYLAKDFTSFRNLLLDDSAQRYPGWLERSEGDVGIMLAEALSALADELSYQQDRVAADLNFATAVGRQALAAHARLVDYEPRPARSARTELMLTVAAGSVPAGALINGVDADGQRIGFETGEGLAGPAAYPVDPRSNWPLAPWWWDEDSRCLPRGSVEMWLVGDALGLVPGSRLLIQTDLDGESIRQIVTLTAVSADFDPLFPSGTGTKLTRIAWDSSDALTRARDLTRTRAGGNLVPATQGVRAGERFATAPAPASAAGATLAIEREGTNGVAVQRLPLRAEQLAWLPDSADPEIKVAQILPEPRDWNHSPTLLDADPFEPAFALDQEAWRAVSFAGDGGATHWEPDGDEGTTLRFGDGVFGQSPEPGAVFDVTYRTGAGAAGNLPADAINEIVAAGAIVEARNPLPAAGGADCESALEVRRFAPQAFRAKPLRAVRAEDYSAAARELSWVQDAAARFRWTGSWHSGFVAADPIGGFDAGLANHIELAQMIDRRRLAAVEAFTPAPRFVSIDLEIDICVKSDAWRDDVERRVIASLAPAGRSRDSTGFFFADRFSFGMPLYRARLEEAIAAIPGVKGVLDIRYRRRAALKSFAPLPAILTVGTGEILRIDNDSDWPERGTITILTEGGA